MLKVEQFIDGQFRDLEAGRATQNEIKTRIFEFLDIQRTVLKMLRETEQNR